MPSFGRVSKSRLGTCHNLLQDILNEAIKECDFSVLCGHRGKAEQDAAYNAGNSKLKFPQSKHNQMPSLAVDIAPYPIDWNDLDRFKELGTIVKKIAKEKGIDLSWGGDWKSFKDYPHFQLDSLKVSKKESEDLLPDGPSEEGINEILEDIEKEAML